MGGGRLGEAMTEKGSSMGARVVITSGFSRRYTGGVREFTVEARNLRGVIKEMDRLYHETAYFQPIREGCEIFFIPKLEGGIAEDPHSRKAPGATDEYGYSANPLSVTAQLPDGTHAIHRTQRSADTRTRRS